MKNVITILIENNQRKPFSILRNMYNYIILSLYHLLFNDLYYNIEFSLRIFLF